MDSNSSVKCKIVVVGDSQCGKTALLNVFAKDCFPEVSLCQLPVQYSLSLLQSLSLLFSLSSLCRDISPPCLKITRPVLKLAYKELSSVFGTPQVRLSSPWTLHVNEWHRLPIETIGPYPWFGSQEWWAGETTQSFYQAVISLLLFRSVKVRWIIQCM